MQRRRGVSARKVIVARMRELNHVPRIRHRRTVARLQLADVTIVPALRRQIMSQTLDSSRRNGKTQLVVVTARKGELARALLSHRAQQLLRNRQMPHLQLHRATARASQLARITQQSVRDVYAGTCVTTQAVAQRQSRGWIEKALAQIAGCFLGRAQARLFDRQTRRSIPGRPGDEYQIARLPARTQQSAGLRDMTQHLHTRSEER